MRARQKFAIKAEQIFTTITVIFGKDKTVSSSILSYKTTSIIISKFSNRENLAFFIITLKFKLCTSIVFNFGTGS